MGAVLCQYDDEGIERPVCYASCTLSEAQQKYGISDRECLAAVWAVRLWRHYLYGSPVVLVTDHSSLTSLMTKHEFTNQRLARYAIDMSEFDITIVHRAGAVHHSPDALSRFSLSSDPEILRERLKECENLWKIALESDVDLGTAAESIMTQRYMAVV